MILDKCFHRNWIEEKSILFGTKSKKSNPELIEKVIYALYLLQELSKANLDFVFKGGTSLLLILEKLHRFSIDVDIVVDDCKVNLKDIFKKISRFKRFEEDIRKNKNDIKKSHYKFYYISAIDNEIKYILLDILFENYDYMHLQRANVNCSFIEVDDSNISVNIPTIDCLLGDKLTAFAPNTTGVPYGINKELEIIKQLFDVSNLFNESNDLKVVKNTFVEIAKNTLKYRYLENLSYIDVLDDIYISSMVIVYNGGKNYKEKYNELLAGIRKFQSYVIGISFNPMVALSCAARASYLAMLIKNDIYSDYFYDKKINVNSPRMLTGGIFKSLKSIDIAGYYYLNQAIKLNKHIG